MEVSNNIRGKAVNVMVVRELCGIVRTAEDMLGFRVSSILGFSFRAGSTNTALVMALYSSHCPGGKVIATRPSDTFLNGKEVQGCLVCGV